MCGIFNVGRQRTPVKGVSLNGFGRTPLSTSLPLVRLRSAVWRTPWRQVVSAIPFRADQSLPGEPAKGRRADPN
jgi:hypothetical protein